MRDLGQFTQEEWRLLCNSRGFTSLYAEELQTPAIEELGSEAQTVPIAHTADSPVFEGTEEPKPQPLPTYSTSGQVFWSKRQTDNDNKLERSVSPILKDETEEENNSFSQE
jgi:hypothetical protein